MNSTDRRRWTNILEKWTPFFIIACTLLGAGLGSFLFYFFQGEFPYEILVGGLIAAMILTVVEILKRIYKKDNIPEADERVARNIFHFFAYTSHIFLAVLFIALSVYTLLGKESISTLYLWIFAFSYIWIAGIGALIIKKR